MDTRKRRQRQSNRKARIIAAASRLVVQKGLEDLSLTAIAKAAGISKGTLYYYYPSKDDLVFDIAEKHVRDITDFLFEIIDSGGPPAEPLELIRLLFRKHQNNRIRMRLHLNLVCQAMNGNDDLKARYQEIYAYWHSRALDALGRLYPADSDQDTLAHLLITTIDGLNVQTMLGMQTLSVEALARYLAPPASP
jgi:AcrR family transcriptional regulator